jgi:hypothetical protein
LYYHAADSTASNRKIVKEYHFVMSDDMDHDPHFVTAALKLVNASIGAPDRAGPITRVWIWSDGCASQFKGRHAFLTRANSVHDHGWECVHNFKASGHGKGEVDGAATLLKNATTRESLKPGGMYINNAQQWHQFCQANLTELSTLRESDK